MLFLASLLLVARAAEPSPPALSLYKERHAAMGTEFTLELYAKDAAAADATAGLVFDEVDRIEQLLSNYRQSSELSRINRRAGLETVTTDAETFDFLQQSLSWSRVSDGAFDITVGRLMKAWGFFRSSGRIPSDAVLAELRGVTGWQKVVLDNSARSVRFLANGIELDPGGIGKGFAVDAAVIILRREHVTAALLSAGGSTLYGLGAPPSAPGWLVDVPNPMPEKPPVSSVFLRDMSLSSANCREKHFIAGGHEYCHIMDPRTLRPVEGRLHVTVLHPSATAGDALSNVLFVSTPARSVEILREHAPESRAIILSGDKLDPRATTFHWQGSIVGARAY